MTEQISLELTREELQLIDKYVELNSGTRQLFNKITNAYAKLPKTPVEEAYNRVYGEYPATTQSVSIHRYDIWCGFQKGYKAAKAMDWAKGK